MASHSSRMEAQCRFRRCERLLKASTRSGRGHTRRHLEAHLEHTKLALCAHILRPLHKASEVLHRLWHIANAKGLGACLKDRVLDLLRGSGCLHIAPVMVTARLSSDVPCTASCKASMPYYRMAEVRVKSPGAVDMGQPAPVQDGKRLAEAELQRRCPSMT